MSAVASIADEISPMSRLPPLAMSGRDLAPRVLLGMGGTSGFSGRWVGRLDDLYERLFQDI